MALELFSASTFIFPRQAGGVQREKSERDLSCRRRGWHALCIYGTSFMSASITNRPLEMVLPGHGGFPSESGQEQSMVRAFICFTEAASSLERAYTQLQGEVARLRRELEVSHRELAESLEENRRMRQHLDRILENLPCGVLVGEPEGRISIANPESRRVLSAISGIALEP